MKSWKDFGEARPGEVAAQLGVKNWYESAVKIRMGVYAFPYWDSLRLSLKKGEGERNCYCWLSSFQELAGIQEGASLKPAWEMEKLDLRLWVCPRISRGE